VPLSQFIPVSSQPIHQIVDVELLVRTGRNYWVRMSFYADEFVQLAHIMTGLDARPTGWSKTEILFFVMAVTR
jgi:hypothetical protein